MYIGSQVNAGWPDRIYERLPNTYLAAAFFNSDTINVWQNKYKLLNLRDFRSQNLK